MTISNNYYGKNQGAQSIDPAWVNAAYSGAVVDPNYLSSTTTLGTSGTYIQGGARFEAIETELVEIKKMLQILVREKLLLEKLRK